jgi:hypothetical protein
VERFGLASVLSRLAWLYLLDSGELRGFRKASTQLFRAQLESLRRAQ